MMMYAANWLKATFCDLGKNSAVSANAWAAGEHLNIPSRKRHAGRKSEPL
jgi:hypothetical protein